MEQLTMTNTPERLQALGEVWRIYEGMDEEVDGKSVLEDRREYDQSLLRDFYKITDEQAFYLHDLVQSHFRPKSSLYNLIPHHTPKDTSEEVVRRIDAVCETIGESMHQSFDGWQDGEKVLIAIYLADIALAAHLTYESRYKQEPQPYFNK